MYEVWQPLHTHALGDPQTCRVGQRVQLCVDGRMPWLAP